MEKVFVTGVAGFVGFHFTKKLLQQGFEVVGVDNVNNYYDVELKYARLAQLGINIQANATENEFVSQKLPFTFIKINLQQTEKVLQIFKKHQFTYAVNLAAQAGVRYSIENPQTYIDSNISGFLSVLEAVRFNPVKHLVFASSSSIYGLNEKFPFAENVFADHPMSIYAATKRANEHMAHSYAHLFNMAVTGLRFFTAYGPWGRPDMALFIFTKKILANEPITVYNNGQMLRDFTFIDDLVEGIYQVMLKPPVANPHFNHQNPIPNKSSAAYQLLNIGNNSPVQLLDFIVAIEEKLGKKALINFEPLQQGDVNKTYADTTELQNWVNYKPSTPIKVGISKFIDWYRAYFKV